jgi:enoyl-CoA hydratase/carnithine racemase
VQPEFITEAVRYEVQGPVATLTLNRPHEGNAVTEDLRQGVVAAWEAVERDPSVRVAIVTGAGDRHFCTGASVEALNAESGLLVDGPLSDCVRLSSHQLHVTKPVICLVNGLVNGAGLHLVVDADIVVATATAAFMDTHTSVGQVGGIENVGLAKRMSLGGALLLTLAGRSYRMPASRAYDLGLVDLLEPDLPSAQRVATELAHSIAQNSPSALRRSKQAIWGAFERGYQSAMEAGWSLVKEQWKDPDFEEGPRAFMEKRAAAWRPPIDPRSGDAGASKSEG